MSIKLNSSGGGSVTLQEPTTATNQTLNLPNATGTLVRADGSNNLLMNSGYGSDAVAYGCRAWVNFNGTGTVAIRASGNVTSITDGGVGTYTVNLTNALPDANYCVNVSAHKQTSYEETPYYNTSLETSKVVVYNVRIGGTFVDTSNMSVAIFR